jgi:hypothetical protein
MENIDSRFFNDPQFLMGESIHLQQEGRLLDSSAYSIAAQCLEHNISFRSPLDIKPVLNVAIGYLMMGDLTQSEKWFDFVIHHEPHNAVALMNLAAIFNQTNRKSQGSELLNAAYKIQRLYIEPIDQPSRKLLILTLGKEAANIPLYPLLSMGRNLNIKYAFDYGSPEEDARLPEFDLIFNAVGEADYLKPYAQRMKELPHLYRKPLLNDPLDVLNTQRNQIEHVLRDIPGLVLPHYKKFALLSDKGDQIQAVLQHRLHYPVIIRPEGTHGGDGLKIAYHSSELIEAVSSIQSTFYLANFINYQSVDLNYRKYRVIFVDRIPYFYHLAISSNWLVHYYSADMLSHNWKIEEEKTFLQSPESVLGNERMNTLLNIGQTLNLEYVGVDFGLMPDGSMVIFEANPTMLIHLESISGPLAYKNEYVKNILQAFENMLEHYSSTKPVY